MAEELAGSAQPVGACDADQVLRRAFEIIVDNNIIKFRHMRDFATRGGNPARDHVGAVLAAPAKPFLQCLDRRRQDEYRSGFDLPGADLSGTLPVDLEQHVVPGPADALDQPAGGPVTMAVNMRPFQEVTASPHALELFDGDEVVMAGMLFTRPWRSR